MSYGAHQRRRVGVALAGASFVIYACTLFAVPQMRDRATCCEQSSLAAAVSKAVYRAPLGTMYSGVLGRFLADLEADNLASMRKTLEETQWTDVPRGTLLQTTADGNGIGYVLFATAALRLFGLHAWALPVLMLVLMGLSAAAFLWRFSGDLAVVVV